MNEKKKKIMNEGGDSTEQTCSVGETAFYWKKMSSRAFHRYTGEVKALLPIFKVQGEPLVRG